MKTLTYENKSVLFTLTPLTTSQISELYGVSRKTLKKWLSPFNNVIGERVGYYFNIAQVKIIFDRLGLPNGNSKEQMRYADDA